MQQQYLPGLEEQARQLNLYELQKTIENTRRGLFKRYNELQKEIDEIKYLMNEKERMAHEVQKAREEIYGT